MAYYLVTGGAGFIGSNITLRLAKLGAKVRVFDNFVHGLSRQQFDEIIRPFRTQIEILDDDVRDANACKASLKNITHVLHHASISSAVYSIENPVETMSVNVVGTANLLNAALLTRHIEKFVNASSCAVYGDGSSNAKTENGMLFPTTPFATSMQATESLSTNIFRSHKLCSGSVRYFNVYGPSELNNDRPRSAVAEFCDAVVKGQDVTVFGSGEQTRDFIHIDDAVDAILAICESESHILAGQIFNIGTGKRTKILDLLGLISEISAKPIECISSISRSHEPMHSKADMMKSSSMLGFNAKITLEGGIAEMLNIASPLRHAA